MPVQFGNVTISSSPAVTIGMQREFAMEADQNPYEGLTHLSLNDPEIIAYWAAKWSVTPLTVMNAIRKVGPLMRDVAVEVWKEA